MLFRFYLNRNTKIVFCYLCHLFYLYLWTVNAIVSLGNWHMHNLHCIYLNIFVNRNRIAHKELKECQLCQPCICDVTYVSDIFVSIGSLMVGNMRSVSNTNIKYKYISIVSFIMRNVLYNKQSNNIINPPKALRN